MTTAKAPQRTARRTQAERSASTRAKLLDAATACLVEHGYGGTTTIRVADLAGVSRGAQLHHFRTRAELLAAVAEHVFATLTEDFRRAFESLDRERARTREAIDVLWTVMRSPLHDAVVELYVAARTDEDLRAALLPVATGHRANVRKLAEDYFPDAAREASLAAIVDVITNALLGLGVARGFYREDVEAADTLAVLGDLAAAADPATADTTTSDSTTSEPTTPGAATTGAARRGTPS